MLSNQYLTEQMLREEWKQIQYGLRIEHLLTHTIVYLSLHFEQYFGTDSVCWSALPFMNFYGLVVEAGRIALTKLF